MAASSSNTPWPSPTPPPVPSWNDYQDHHRASKRRRRQVITDQSQVNQAMIDCQINSGNYVYSCFPTAETRIFQHQYASFVWNSRRPELTQTNLVDVFLFRGDSQQQLLHFRELPNPSDQAGLIRAQVNDTWFGSDGDRYSPGGANLTFPFYWVIIRSDNTLDGNEVAQPIFTAVQTAVLDSVAAASSSASLASASSSAIIAASLSSLSASRSAAANPSSSGNVQHASSSSSFPRWAIAVIVVLGFLAIAATCILAFLILRRIRRRRTSDRDSMGSASPMIKNRDSHTTGGGVGGVVHEKGNIDSPPGMIQRYDSTASPLLPPPSIGGAAGAFVGGSTHDAASTISDSGGPFSGADAAIMADAFRKMLRKPDFAAQGDGNNPRESGGGFGAEEGYEGEDIGDVEQGGDRAGVLRDQLAEEGRDLRSVSSSRGVKVESPS